MKFLKHLFEQPFIAATGFAALIHSTWALGTFFAGIEPARWTIDWWGWLLPALLIAFSLDVGQISTSMKIREHGLKWGNALAFVVIALFTYFLQFLHLAHHMPNLPLAAGISESHRWAALWLRDFAIWLIPALLPLSTLLYTFSTDDRQEQAIEQEELKAPDFTIEKRKNEELPALEQPEEHNNFVPIVLNLDNPLLPDLAEDESSEVANLLIEQPLLAEWQIEGFVSECDCGRMFRGTSQEQADRALRAHRVHCKNGR
jgi:hypothetical protein